MVVMGKVRPVDHAAVIAWVRATTAAQGLPEKVLDPTILRAVAVLLRPGLAGLPAPRRRYSRRVEPVATTDRRSNDDVVEEGSDDAVLSRQREVGPLAAERAGVTEVGAERSGSGVDVEGVSG